MLGPITLKKILTYSINKTQLQYFKCVPCPTVEVDFQTQASLTNLCSWDLHQT